MQLLTFTSKYTNEVIAFFTQAFSDSEGENEGKIIGDLVSNLIISTEKQDLLGFVAMENEQIISCIFFSRMTVPNKQTAFILSPVATSTEHQGKGIAQKLIKFGIEQLKSNHVDLLFTYGDRNFYSKVGFQQISEDIVKAPLKLSYTEGWLAQSLISSNITPMAGSTQCVPALNQQKYW